MNMGVQISLQVLLSILLGYIPRSGIAGTDGNSIFNVFEGPLFFSTMAELFYILSVMHKEFQFIHILTNTCYFLIFS